MLEEIKKAQEDANKKNEQLEAYNHKIDRANGYLEAENRRLRKQLETAC
jgi:phage-related tail protein